MLLTILARMSNDEQRWQLLQTLRNKLASYHLDWFDIGNLVDLFSQTTQIRFDVVQFLLLYINHCIKPIDVEDYIHLSQQCTNNNEQLKVRLFEQIHEKLNIRNRNDFEPIIELFQTMNIRQKIEAMIRINRPASIFEQYQEINEQHLSSLQLTSSPEQIIAHSILSPTSSSFVEELSHAPLKRKYSFDNEYQSCHQIITPSLIIEQDEFIQQRDLLSSISVSSSNSSLSSASDEYIPIRTHSFMVAIKSTFERLKETSS